MKEEKSTDTSKTPPLTREEKEARRAKLKEEWKARRLAQRAAFEEKYKDIYPNGIAWGRHLDECEHCRRIVRGVKFSGGLYNLEHAQPKCCEVGKQLCKGFLDERPKD